MQSTPANPMVIPGFPALRRFTALALVAVAALLFAHAAAPAQVIQKEEPSQLQGLELTKKLGDRVPLDFEFTDSTGAKVKLGKYFNQGSKPVVLALVYYNCPMMCPLVLSRIQERLNGINYSVGDDFNVVVVSFDPSNTTKMAADNKASYLAGYNKNSKSTEAGWTFHTSDPVNVRKLADAVGFPYRYMPESGQYAHAAALTVLTPDGRVSGYIDGISADGGELKLALLQASEGKIAKSIGDFFLTRCYRYDPRTGTYTVQATRVMQIGGLLTVMGITTLLVGLRAAERARKQRIARLGAAGGEVSKGTDHKDQRHGPDTSGTTGSLMGRTA
jgi:protein SCO1/2